MEDSLLGWDWKIDCCADVLTTESSALRFGLLLAQKAGCNDLVVNSENMEVIEIMESGARLAGVAATTYDDCYSIASDFPLVRFEHCNREENKVAHELARLAKFTIPRDWFEDPMRDTELLIIDDVTIISSQ
ncbi:hypothetical protein ZWY2020_054546 [Hordeum vulgare]|nr:hypothetical protein ZWY2020_052081 [Hordeum vulgare]KAI4998944.1 hypothetical protein ZWY2020_054546 [Hordeum vulgare]